jgi:hypothetical protein
VHAEVVEGQLSEIFESTNIVMSTEDLSISVFWSTASPSQSGYFYAGGAQDLGIYVAEGMTDPTVVSDATSFAYQQSGALLAREGDSLFVRTGAGNYAAIKLVDFAPLDPPVPNDCCGFYYSTLNGAWYLDTTGAGDFTSPVPEPSRMVMLALGLMAFAGLRTRVHWLSS